MLNGVVFAVCDDDSPRKFLGIPIVRVTEDRTSFFTVSSSFCRVHPRVARAKILAIKDFLIIRLAAVVCKIGLG